MLAAVSVTTAIVNLPAFLVGALAFEMRRDLGYPLAATGVAVGMFYLATAMSAPIMARAVHRRRAGVGLSLGTGLSAVTMVVVAAWARDFATVAAALVLGGAANSMGQTAANVALARTSLPGADGLAFGIKQASVPIATMLAGLAVPLFAVGGGWRLAWFIGGLGAAGVAVVLGAVTALSGPRRGIARGSHAMAAPPSSDIRWRVLAPIAVGAFFGAGLTMGLAAYVVEYALMAGWAAGHAGVLLAVASVVVVLCRITSGWWADRRARRGSPFAALRTSALLMCCGALGCLMLVGGQAHDALLVGGFILGLGLGWGWPGLMHLSVIATHRAAAARATGIILVAVFSGGVVMPTVLGLVVDRGSYPMAWMLGAVSLSVAAIAHLVAHLSLSGEQAAGSLADVSPAGSPRD